MVSRLGKFLADAIPGVLVAGAVSAATVVNGGFPAVSRLTRGGLKTVRYGIDESISGWNRTPGGIELQNNATLGNRDANSSRKLVSGLADGVASADWMKVTSGNFQVNGGYKSRLTFSAEGISNGLGGRVNDLSITAGSLRASALLPRGALSGMSIAARRHKSRAG